MSDEIRRMVTNVLADALPPKRLDVNEFVTLRNSLILAIERYTGDEEDQEDDEEIEPFNLHEAAPIFGAPTVTQTDSPQATT